MLFSKINKRVEMISEHYHKIEDERDKIQLELSLKESINDIDKYSFLSLALFVVPNTVKAIVWYYLSNYADEVKYHYEFIMYSTIYCIFALMIIIAVLNYRFYKLYLNVISEIGNGRIIVNTNIKTVTTDIEEIEIIYKSKKM